MTRFHGALIVAVLLGVAALAFGSVAGLMIVFAALLILIALGVAFPQMRFFGSYVCRGSATEKQVALTFDDGPDPDSTTALLDVLREAGVEVAFFGIGRRVRENAALASRIVREGHLLENHSFEHHHATNLFTLARLKADLARAQAAVQEATGFAPRYFRPPIGLSNPRVFRPAQELGLTVVGWTIRSLDTRMNEPERIVRRIVKRLGPGAIILLHDGHMPAPKLVATVKSLLDALRSLGYEVVRLDRLLS
jgi:peptidoglycan/xylan/chitin deacetylase (PgdA/CDA1 family)